MERLEDRFTVAHRNAGALVADLQQATCIQAHANGAASAAVDDGVVHQISDHPPQRQAVAMDPHWHLGRIHFEAVTGPHHQRRQIGGRFAHQQRQIQPLQCADITIKSLQVKQVLGNVTEPRNVGQQLRLQLALRQLRQARLHYCNRHPQFVRGIGEELVTRGIPLLHLVDRVVEGFHQRCDLGRHQLRIQTRPRLADIQLLGLLCGAAHAAHRAVDHGRHDQ